MDYASSILGFLPGGRRSTGISQLLEKLEAYLPPAQIERVRESYEFGAQRHQGQKRLSGEPYITHPVAVADILADLHLDADTLIVGRDWGPGTTTASGYPFIIKRLRRGAADCAPWSRFQKWKRPSASVVVARNCRQKSFCSSWPDLIIDQLNGNCDGLSGVLVAVHNRTDAPATGFPSASISRPANARSAPGSSLSSRISIGLNSPRGRATTRSTAFAW